MATGDKLMTELPAIYRRENGTNLVEIRLNSIRQLFNSLDPSPFHEKDLDRDAEEYIVETVRELPSAASFKIRIFVPESERAVTGSIDLPRAVHNYFSYRLWVMQRRLRDLMRRGRDALLVAIVFLALTFAIREAVFTFSTETIAHLLAEGLQIAGWVALWQPIQIFLYDWQPIRRVMNVYRRLADVVVEVQFMPAEGRP
jgi:hypothetical protein